MARTSFTIKLYPHSHHLNTLCKHDDHCINSENILHTVRKSCHCIVRWFTGETIKPYFTVNQMPLPMFSTLIKHDINSYHWQYCCLWLESGRRDSNPRQPAWKAGTLANWVTSAYALFTSLKTGGLILSSCDCWRDHMKTSLALLTVDFLCSDCNYKLLPHTVPAM